ncbi:MAG: multidrug transporter AcrB [Rickettsiaceae bacterium]|nr:multidrug transporter AcrB [Rickettsiaceae bacterium]
MIISDICIRRPVFATVINIMLILLGLVAYDRLTVREYPKIDEPVVTVRTVYLGASSEIVESQISKPLEDSLAGIEGIEVISSISRQETSQITVRFKITRDPESAAADVRDRVSRVRGQLPEAVEEPIISKVEADAQPIIYLAFYSDRHSPMEISDYADRYVKDRLQNLNGVADVSIFGERRMSMRLWLKPERLAAYGLTVQDIENALRHQNVEIPAGLIESQNREFTVLSETDLRTPEEFNNLIIKKNGDSFVRFRDIGHSEIAPEDERRTTRFNGKDAVALGVIKQATANPLEVSGGVKNVLPEIESSLPQGMQINVAYDSSIFIDRSIKAVYHTIAEAVILVVLVIFFFLRSVRSTMIPLVTIPVSLIGTFMMMYIFGFSINTLTLLAIVLAIGLVVDDAIVMLENIYRHIENGMKPIDAALKGSKEIAFAVVAMTLTLAAVYAPIAFSQGRTGKLFTEFALTLAGAVIISGFIALTLSPMMCSRFLKHEKKHGAMFNTIERWLSNLQDGYGKLLNWALKHTKTVLVIGGCVALTGVIFFKLLPTELSPTEDRGTILAIAIAPEGSTIDYTTYWMKKMEPIFVAIPEVEKYFVVAGMPSVSQGIAFMRLKDWDDRHRKQQEISAELSPKLFGGIPGVMSFAVNPPSLGRSAASKPVEFIIQTTGTYEELNDVTNKFLAELQKYPGITNVDTDLKLNKPQITVSLNRDKTAAVGIDVDTVGRTLETMLGGRKVTRFKKEGQQYDVIVKVQDEQRTSPTDISEIYVRGYDNKMIELSNLVSLKENVAPRELNHFNQLRSVKITANLAPGTTLGTALDALQTKAKEVLPRNMMYDLDGESREFKQSSASLAVTFILALLFIYLVLAAQFESFINPLVIMLSVPLSMAGALFTLYITNGTLNIYSQIGLITLIGLITKHGILIIEFTHQLEESGKDVLEALHEACQLRLRPILMTTGAMVLGALPLAIATGAGAESRNQIGWVIIGGMMVGTLFTLFVIPTIYAMVKTRGRNFWNEQKFLDHFEDFKD